MPSNTTVRLQDERYRASGMVPGLWIIYFRLVRGTKEVGQCCFEGVF